MLKLIVLPLLFLIMFGCQHPCGNSPLNPAFVGFSQSDIDTFVLRAYEANGNYDQLIDTFLISKSGPGIYTTTNDTTIVELFINNSKSYIRAGFDWQIYIPAENKTISISNIISNQAEGPSKGCLNPINSFLQDGKFTVPQLINTDNSYTSGYMAYINNN